MDANPVSIKDLADQVHALHEQIVNAPRPAYAQHKILDPATEADLDKWAVDGFEIATAAYAEGSWRIILIRRPAASQVPAAVRDSLLHLRAIRQDNAPGTIVGRASAVAKSAYDAAIDASPVRVKPLVEKKEEPDAAA